MTNAFIEDIRSKLLSHASIILSEQQKEWTNLHQLQEKMGLSIQDQAFQLEETKELDALSKNEDKLVAFAEAIRQNWRSFCFQETKHLSIATELRELDNEELTIQNTHNILSTYEREATSFNLIPIKTHPAYTCFNSLFSSGMAAIHSLLTDSLATSPNQNRALLSSIGYFETISLVESVATTTQSHLYKAEELASQEDLRLAIEASSVIFLEPTMSNYRLEDSPLTFIVDTLKNRSNTDTKTLILDTSFNGNTFSLQKILDDLAHTGTRLIIIRSLSKMDQAGLSLCNAGFAEFFYPQQLSDSGEPISSTDTIMHLNKLQNFQGNKLSFFAYRLLDNGFTLTKDDAYARNLLLNVQIFHSQFSLNSKKSNHLFANPNSPYLTFVPGEGDNIDNAYINIILNGTLKEIGMTRSHRVNFGFRNAVIHNYQDAATLLHVFRISPGVFRGLHFWTYVFILDQLAPKNSYELYEIKRDFEEITT